MQVPEIRKGKALAESSRDRRRMSWMRVMGGADASAKTDEAMTGQRSMHTHMLASFKEQTRPIIFQR
jgi:hypothetical protein